MPAGILEKGIISCKVKPPLKWAGGKRQLLSQMKPLFPKSFVTYLEPFLGGGAVFFDMQPTSSVLIDNNFELINFYLVVKEEINGLMRDLRRHKNTPEYYYYIRSLNPEKMDELSRASRFLYLNKTAYNGLWRVNKQGKHNVPFGWYKKPCYIDENNLRMVSSVLKEAVIVCDDFSKVLERSVPDAFIYMDPPYYPLTRTANFTSYTSESFNIDDQKRVAAVFRELDSRGCKVMLSESDTDFIRKLYKFYDIKTVYAKRAISCRGDRRGYVTELIIRNYS